jgi:pentatricopeptide repeat protein
LIANGIIYGAAISSCRKAKEPQRAMGLLQKIISVGLTPYVACFNTVLIAQADVKRPKENNDTIICRFTNDDDVKINTKYLSSFSCSLQ